MKAIIRIVWILAVLAFALLPTLLCLASGEVEMVAIAAAKARAVQAAHIALPDDPPGLKLNNIPKPKQSAVVETPHATVAGLHSHRCPIDGTIWQHGADQFGVESSHKCPKCGRVVWEIHQPVKQAAPVKQVVPVQAKAAQSPCPGGVCPLPTRRRLFR